MPKTTPASDAGGVHTSAQPAALLPPAKASKPTHHQPTPPSPRDEHTGKGGRYVRDPITGVRQRAAD